MQITNRYYSKLKEVYDSCRGGNKLMIDFEMFVYSPLQYAESIVSMGIGKRENMQKAVEFIDPELVHWRTE
jgi:hypothetical protein